MHNRLNQRKDKISDLEDKNSTSSQEKKNILYITDHKKNQSNHYRMKQRKAKD